MGTVLFDYYTKAGKIGGIKARTKLSILTKTSSFQAKCLADIPENFNRFEKAMKEILEEFKDPPQILSEKKSAFETKEEQTDRLRRYVNAFVDLAAQRSLYMHSFPSLLNRVTETIAYTINVERASIWFIDNDRKGIVCKDIFLESLGQHSQGIFLATKDFPNYFKALRSERTLPADDAMEDPRTSEFAENYLKPNGITSMMDVPIWANGKMIGIVCHEHVGPMRTWTIDEENFAYLMSNVIAMAIEGKWENHVS